MQEHEYKARDKTVQKMSRDGLREENLRNKEEKRITGRDTDTEISRSEKKEELDFSKRRHERLKEEREMEQPEQPSGTTMEITAPVSDFPDWGPASSKSGQTQAPEQSEPETEESLPETSASDADTSQPESSGLETSQPETEFQSEQQTSVQSERGALSPAWILGGGALLIAAGAGGFWYWKRRKQM